MVLECFLVRRQNAGTVSTPVALSSQSNASRVEWDLYGGYKASRGNWMFDAGAIHYAYPGRYENVGAYRKPDTTEVYGSAGYKWVTLKYSYTVSRYFFGSNEASGANYLDLSATVPLAEGMNLLLHVGRQTYPVIRISATSAIRAVTTLFTAIPTTSSA